MGTDVQAGNFEVFEISPEGTRERLLARLSAFDDAKTIAEIARGKSRVVVHFGEVVWPRPDQGSEQADRRIRQTSPRPMP